MACNRGQQLDGADSVTAGVLASLIATAIYSIDPAVFPGGASMKWSLVGLLAGYFGLRLAINLTGRPRMAAMAVFGAAGAYLLLRSTVLPPPGIPLALQLANAVAGAAALTPALYLALGWDHHGRHRRRVTTPA